jgi:signal transduction histidine kinase
MTTYRLLAVDDELALRTGEVRILRNFKVEVPTFGETVSFEIAEAASGEEALERVEEARPDVMLLDLGLPGIQGMDVLQRVVQAGHDTAVIIVTAYASIETAVSTTKQGAFDFLAKPFTPEELRKTVAKATEYLFTRRHAERLESEKAQQRFQLISIVSHELKSPINAVETYLKVLADPGIEKTPEMLDRIVDRSMKRIVAMRKLIVDLLDLTRIESGQKKRDIADTSLAEAARRAVEGVSMDAQARAIEIAVDVDEAARMRADPGELDIILNNLVSNAVKYNRDAGSVHVRIRRDADLVTIEVADTGIGMAKDDAAKLFQEFLRIKTPKTATIPGTGLGLSIVRRLARLYGGDATVMSEPDVGTTFTVTLKDAAAPDPKGE